MSRDDAGHIERDGARHRRVESVDCCALRPGRADPAAIRNAMLLYAVTDRAWCSDAAATAGHPASLVEQVACALKGGATCIQLREKSLDRESFLDEALEVKALCKAYDVPFIIDDDVELAVNVGADGVHVGQEDMAPSRARGLIGAEAMLGVSAQTVEEALAAQEQGADYLGVGAMFPTSTKLDAHVVSFEELAAITSAVSIPVVAIGGICAGNIQKLSGLGLSGIAVASAIFAAADITRATEELKAASERMVSGGADGCTTSDGCLE